MSKIKEEQKIAVQTHDLTKRFDQVIACDKVSFDVKKGEILALLGENGSGKTTLMNMLSGIYFPDDGTIEVAGNEVTIKTPKNAFDLGIGMVHQHFKLVDLFTAAENIVLGLPGGVLLDRKGQGEKIREISSRYGFALDPDKKIYNMSVSEKQTVEIIKVLYRGAEILILDEPTAVLTPQESEQLFITLRNMRDDGKAIIIITHKLNEVMAVSDRVHVLRRGKSIATVNTSETTPKALTEMMVGQAIDLKIERPKVEEQPQRLLVKDLNCQSPDGVQALKNINFDLKAGEILGVAGVAGNGQKELCEALSGLYPTQAGEAFYHTETGEIVNLVGKTPQEIKELGVLFAFVPEDRLGMGLVANMDMTENMLLRYYDSEKHPFVNRKHSRSLAQTLIEQLKIVTPGISTPVRKLSGGNVQKVLLGREIASAPRVLIVAYPVRGLDINSSYTIYNLLNEQKKRGVAVLFIGEDLDVLLEISDRIMVLCGGQISGLVDARNTSKEEVGLLMTRLPSETQETEGKGQGQ